MGQANQVRARACRRCRRKEGQLSRRGKPLRIPLTGKWAGYCQGCASVISNGGDPTPLEPTPTVCVMCGRRSTPDDPVRISGWGSKFPGRCTACAHAMRYRTRTYPVVTCAGCGRTHTRTGKLLMIVKSGPYRGLCGSCQVRKKKTQAQAEEPGHRRELDQGREKP